MSCSWFFQHVCLSTLAYFGRVIDWCYFGTIHCVVTGEVCHTQCILFDFASQPFFIPNPTKGLADLLQEVLSQRNHCFPTEPPCFLRYVWPNWKNNATFVPGPQKVSKVNVALFLWFGHVLPVYLAFFHQKWKFIQNWAFFAIFHWFLPQNMHLL